MSLVLLFSLLGGLFSAFTDESLSIGGTSDPQTLTSLTVEPFPTFDGQNDVVALNGDNPSFTEADLSLEKGCWQSFSELDRLNRVGAATTMLHESMMPTEARGDIRSIKPTDWHQKN